MVTETQNKKASYFLPYIDPSLALKKCHMGISVEKRQKW